MVIHGSMARPLNGTEPGICGHAMLRERCRPRTRGGVMRIPVPARKTRLVLGAAALSGVMVAMSLAVMSPANADGPLAVDQIAHSKNMELVTNIPRQGPLTDDFHSDMAFWGNYLFQGSYGGITVYDVSH